jgi:hypothetical protein
VARIAQSRARDAARDQEARRPGQSRARRARAAEADAMVAAGIETFGAFATTDFARDMMRARWDVDFFCQRFLGFVPHPGQSRLFRAYITRDESRWQPRYLTITASAGNRAGKTLGLAVVVLHSAFFKMGLRPPNALDARALERWRTLSYEWYHFGIHTEVAELLYHEIVRLLSGTHEAQKFGCPLKDMFGSAFVDWSKKYRGEYLMVVFHSDFGGGTIHFRTTGERAIGSLGKDMHGLSFDEAPFEPNFTFVINEVLRMRRLGTGGQMFLIGTTTEGLTEFADKWREGDPENPERRIDSISIRISTRENVGFGIETKMFDRLVAGMPPYLIPQNIDGHFIEARESFFGAQTVEAVFTNDLPELQAATRGHRYVQGVDPALTFDSTWSIVLDVTDGQVWDGVLCDMREGRQTSLSVSALAMNSHNAYTDPERRISCTTGLDATGFGGKMFRDLLPLRGVRMVEFGGTKQKKLRLLNELKKTMEGGRLRLPRHGKWLRVRRQLLGYKLDDRKIEQDAVMALAVAVDVAKRNPGAMQPEGNFDFFAPQSDVPSIPTEVLLRMLRDR